jgi:hypothetical protein
MLATWTLHIARPKHDDPAGIGVKWRAIAYDTGEVASMARIEGVDPQQVEGPIKAVFEAQAKKWGAPLLNHLLYARRPTIFRGVRAMWTGLDSSGLLPATLPPLLNRRVAMLNGCVF